MALLGMLTTLLMSTFMHFTVLGLSNSLDNEDVYSLLPLSLTLLGPAAPFSHLTFPVRQANNFECPLTNYMIQHL